MKTLINSLPKPTLLTLTSLLMVATILLVLHFHESPPVIISSKPQNSSTEIPLDADFAITFAKSLSPRQKTKLSFSLSPHTNLVPQWQSARTLILTPEQKLKPNTDYILTLKFRQQTILNLNFKTSLSSPEEIKQQAKDDLDYGQKERSFYQQNRWYGYLPIENPNYQIVYNFKRKLFIIYLKKPESEQLLQQAIKNLKAISPPTPLKYKVYPYPHPSSRPNRLLY